MRLVVMMMAVSGLAKLAARLRVALFVGALMLVCLVSLSVVSGAQAYVYWTNNQLGTIGRANLDGSWVNQSFTTGPSLPWGMAVDGSHIYWASAGTNTLGRANLDGTGANNAFITGMVSPMAVAVDGAHLYWVDMQYTNASTIGRANLDGTGVNRVLVRVYAVVRGLAVDGAHIYWTEGFNNTIGRANLDGTGVSDNFISGTAVKYPQAVAVDGSHIYWANFFGDSIGRANLDGSSPSQSFIPGYDITGIAVDRAHIYWTNQSTNTIGRANLDGTGVNENFITGTKDPFGVAVDPLQPSAKTTVNLVCSGPLGYVGIEESTNCTATLSDQSATPSALRGTLKFSAVGVGMYANEVPGSFTSTSCTLPGSSSSATCQTTWTPYVWDPIGSQFMITASYGGDSIHLPSSSQLMLEVVVHTVTAPALLTNVSQSANLWEAGSALPQMTTFPRPKANRRSSSATKPPVGTTFAFTLKHAGRVWFFFTHRTTGRRVNGRCVAQTSRNRASAPCLRTMRAAFSRQARAGRTRLRFEGRLDRKRTLLPGLYKLIIVATANGKWSKPASLRFTILPTSLTSAFTG